MNEGVEVVDEEELSWSFVGWVRVDGLDSDDGVFFDEGSNDGGDALM